MIDQMFDRSYQAARSDLNALIASAFARFGDAVGNAFVVLNKIEYQAPWTAKRKRARHH